MIKLEMEQIHAAINNNKQLFRKYTNTLIIDINKKSDPVNLKEDIYETVKVR